MTLLLNLVKLGKGLFKRRGREGSQRKLRNKSQILNLRFEISNLVFHFLSFLFDPLRPLRLIFLSTKRPGKLEIELDR
jgi:hypothetical protein